MTVQNSVVVRDNRNDSKETTIGVSAVLQIRTGAQPATCATAASGTLLGSATLPSDWLSNSSGGTKSKLGTWSGTASATGVAGHYRILDSTATTCHEQGSIVQAVALTTSASSAANSNVLTFAATTGVAVGQLATGTGIIANSTVLAFTGTTVTLSQASTAGVSITTSISFGGDMNIDNASLANLQAFTVTAYAFTASGA